MNKSVDLVWFGNSLFSRQLVVVQLVVLERVVLGLVVLQLVVLEMVVLELVVQNWLLTGLRFLRWRARLKSDNIQKISKPSTSCHKERCEFQDNDDRCFKPKNVFSTKFET